MAKVTDKEKILKTAREKQLGTYKGASRRLSDNFSKETLQVRRDWQEIFKVKKSMDLQPKWHYPAKLSFRIKGQIKNFPDKKKLKESIITKPLLHEMLKGFFKKKKIQTMNNKMAINMYLSTTESKKQAKRTKITETESWIQRMF